MLPTDTLTSMLDEPSSGSNTSRNPPRAQSAGIWYGASSSSEAIPASNPPRSVHRRTISLASTSSFCCCSPCTFVAPAAPSTPLNAPDAVRCEIALQASATSAINAVISWLEPGSSVKNCVSVGRSVSMFSPRGGGVLS